MTATERKEALAKAKQLYTTNFNNLEFGQRKMLASPSDRLLEINMAISKGDQLNMAYLKKRRKELEDWLLEWYQEQTA